MTGAIPAVTTEGHLLQTSADLGVGSQLKDGTETSFGTAHNLNYFISLFSCVSHFYLLFGQGTMSQGHGFTHQGTPLWFLRSRVGIPRRLNFREESQQAFAPLYQRTILP
jgi:hypothetical protein